MTTFSKLTVETVRTQVGHCHKIGPLPGSCGKNPGCACVYVDGQHAPRAQTGREQELLAYANLFAAAPDLLEACEAAKAFVAPGSLWNTLDDAIRKAKGESDE